MFGQHDKPKPGDEVLRINTELGQTGVTVVDKQGRFVDGLTKEDFELLVDGHPVPISFFENIVAGSTRDRSKRLTAKDEPTIADHAPAVSIRRRTIVWWERRQRAKARILLLGAARARLNPGDALP